MKQNKFLKYFTGRLKLSARRVSTSQEVWHIFISRGSLIITSLVLFVALFFGIFFLIIYTPSLIDHIPGYLGRESKEKMISSLLKLDSLEREVTRWEEYTTTLRSILDGKKLESIVMVDGISDSLQGSTKSKTTERTIEDSLLRFSVEQSTIESEATRRDKTLSFSMIAPVEGVVTSGFSSAEGVLGVVVKPKASSVVLSVMDGTVIFSDWTPSEGYVVVVQHAAAMMSVYKKLSQSLKSQGNRIKAGESLGISQGIKDGASPEFEFELWNEGNAIDPENYITFTAPETTL